MHHYDADIVLYCDDASCKTLSIGPPSISINNPLNPVTGVRINSWITLGKLIFITEDKLFI